MDNANKRGELLQRLSLAKKASGAATVENLPEGTPQVQSATDVTKLMTGEIPKDGAGVMDNSTGQLPGAVSQATQNPADTGDKDGIGNNDINTADSGKNAEINEIEKSEETLIKDANALIDVCTRISATPESIITAALSKCASAEEGNEEAHNELLNDYIMKKASEGDEAANQMINFHEWCQRGIEQRDRHISNLIKNASMDTPVGAQLRAYGVQGENAPHVAHQLLMKMASENPGEILLDDEGALLEGLEEGDIPEGLLQEEGAIPPEVAEAAAIEAAAMDGGEGVEGTADIEDEVRAEVEMLMLELAAEIQEATGLDDEAALVEAEKIVVDGLETASFQEAAGAVDENGEYLLPDENFEGGLDVLEKTASDNQLRGQILPVIHERFGVSPGMFIKRASELEASYIAKKAAADQEAEAARIKADEEAAKDAPDEKAQTEGAK